MHTNIIDISRRSVKEKKNVITYLNQTIGTSQKGSIL